MNERLVAEKKELEKLEEAAEQAEEPEQIREQAGKAEEAARSARLWFVPYVLLAAVIGGGIMLVDWNGLPIKHELAVKFHRYLLGALGVIIVLGAAPAIEVYVLN